MIFSKKGEKLDPSLVPAHVGFVMDGNGRWAKKRGMPRTAGHRSGAKNIKRIAKYCYKVGVKSITLYAFSTENWKRPQGEVDALMSLLSYYLDHFREELDGDDARIVVIGDRSRLSDEINRKITLVEEETAQNKGLLIQLAINYGGRDEIARAASLAAKEGEITPESISRHLYTGFSEVDLVIRTGGEQRISNFLLWQSAYCEFYYTDVLWPDLSEKDVLEALLNFQRRDRRFGGVEE